jgi:hypothetical protein
MPETVSTTLATRPFFCFVDLERLLGDRDVLLRFPVDVERDELVDFEELLPAFDLLVALFAEALEPVRPDELAFDGEELDFDPPPERDELADLPDLAPLLELFVAEVDRFEVDDLDEVPERDDPPDRDVLLEDAFPVDLLDEDLAELELFEPDDPEREPVVDFLEEDPRDPEDDFPEDPDFEPEDLFDEPPDDDDFELDDFFDVPADADFEPDDFFDDDEREPVDFFVAAIKFLPFRFSFDKNLRRGPET